MGMEKVRRENEQASKANAPLSLTAMDRCGQCEGCALKRGAAANLTVNNHLVAILSVAAGTPFLCHDKLGWVEGQDGYPAGMDTLQRAWDSLKSAPALIHNSPDMKKYISDATTDGLPPRFFDDNRKMIGRAPLCGGWKAAVRQLHEAGWFKGEAGFARKRAAAECFVELDAVLAKRGDKKRLERLFTAVIHDVRLVLGGRLPEWARR